jgi:hypothetical protein
LQVAVSQVLSGKLTMQLALVTHGVGVQYSSTSPSQSLSMASPHTSSTGSMEPVHVYEGVGPLPSQV